MKTNTIFFSDRDLDQVRRTFDAWLTAMQNGRAEGEKGPEGMKPGERYARILHTDFGSQLTIELQVKLGTRP